MKVLLAEDEQRLATALSFLLKKNGYVADIAPDGETALEMAATGVYDILVLDRILPFRDGLSVLKEYRKLGYDTPALFLTALDSVEDRTQGLDCGADDLPSKAFCCGVALASTRVEYG